MSLLIDDLFDADPESEVKRKVSPNADVDAIMKGGYYDAALKKPVNTSFFLFHFNNPDNAAHLAEMYGGSPVEDEESAKEFNISLFPDEKKGSEIEGVLTAEGIYADMRMFNQKNQLVHHCTGTKFITHPTDDDMIGQPCGCPTKMADRKKAATAGIGPDPNIEIKFRLANDYSKRIKFQTGSWVLLRQLRSLVQEVIVKGKGEETAVTFAKEQLDFTTADGKHVTPIVPKVTVLGAYDDVNAQAA